jgi:hypothetical protein
MAKTTFAAISKIAPNTVNLIQAQRIGKSPARRFASHRH